MEVKITYTHGKTISFHILHELTASSYNSNDSTVRNSLFGAVRLTKQANIGKYGGNNFCSTYEFFCSY